MVSIFRWEVPWWLKLTAFMGSVTAIGVSLALALDPGIVPEDVDRYLEFALEIQEEWIRREYR